MSLKEFIKNRPFEPDDEVLELLKDWATPDFREEAPVVVEKTNALGLTPPRPGQRIQARRAEPEEVKPLTADDIEQIRQAAYDEGLQQGKDDGFSQGYNEGREQGYQDGLQQGQAEGRKQGLDEGEGLIREQLTKLSALIDRLQQPLQQVDQQVEQSLLQLALAMAQAVVAVEVRTNPQVVLESLRQCLELLPLKASDIRIQAHPDDIAVIKQHFSEDDIAKRGWQLQAEPALDSGDLRLQTGDSLIIRPLKQRVQQSLEQFLQSQPE